MHVHGMFEDAHMHMCMLCEVSVALALNPRSCPAMASWYGGLVWRSGMASCYGGLVWRPGMAPWYGVLV